MGKIIFYDAENLHDGDLNLVDILSSEFKIIILYSNRMNKFHPRTIESIVNADATVEFYEVKSSGTNALDFHLVAMAATFIRSNSLEEVYVLSKDKDYRHLISFCKSFYKKDRIKIHQYSTIQEIISKEISTDKGMTFTEKYGFLAK